MELSNLSEKMGKKIKHIKIDLLARNKLNSSEKIIPKALIDLKISHRQFNLVTNEEQNYFRLKKSIRAKDDQLSDIEQDGLIENGKRIGQNERKSIKLKIEV